MDERFEPFGSRYHQVLLPPASGAMVAERVLCYGKWPRNVSSDIALLLMYFCSFKNLIVFRLSVILNSVVPRLSFCTICPSVS